MTLILSQNLAEAIERPDSDLARQYGGQRVACEHLSSTYYSYVYGLGLFDFRSSDSI